MYAKASFFYSILLLIQIVSKGPIDKLVLIHAMAWCRIQFIDTYLGRQVLMN